MGEKLLPLLEKYKNFKKEPKKWVVDMSIFDTIAQTLLK
jgi:hypothetical protein